MKISGVIQLVPLDMEEVGPETIEWPALKPDINLNERLWDKLKRAGTDPEIRSRLPSTSTGLRRWRSGLGFYKTFYQNPNKVYGGTNAAARNKYNYFIEISTGNDSNLRFFLFSISAYGSFNFRFGRFKMTT